jgi:hypothetical protein
MRHLAMILLGILINIALYAQWSSYQKPDTIIIDREAINTDTLFISGYVADCGEFGGYIDRIKIFRSNGEFHGLLIKGLKCKPSIIGYNPFLKSVVIDSTKITNILDYMQQFSKLAITHSEESNAPTEFWISYKSNKYHRWDPSGQWTNFVDLRDKIFKKNN